MFRHRFDPSALVAGVLFLGFGLRYLGEGTGGQVIPFPYTWTTPAAVGTVVVIMVLRRVFRRRRDS